MSTYLDFSVKTREGFKSWILTMLGEPLITVELHDTQLDVCINNAVEEFTKYVSQEQEYLAVNLNDYDSTAGGVTLPSNVQGVFGLDDDINGAGASDVLFSVPNQMWNAGIYPFFNNGQASCQGWITYELAMEAVDFAKYMTGKGYQFDYNPRNKLLTLYPDPTKSDGSRINNGYIVLGCYTIRPETMQYGESWVRRYALAEAKIILGAVRGKFEGVQLLGGGTVDSSIRDQGISERDQLMEELRVQEAGPYGFFVG